MEGWTAGLNEDRRRAFRRLVLGEEILGLPGEARSNRALKRQSTDHERFARRVAALLRNARRLPGWGLAPLVRCNLERRNVND